MRTLVIAASAFSFVPMIAMGQAPVVEPAAAAAPMVEQAKEDFKFGGKIRALMLLSNTLDESAVQHYGLNVDRARLFFSKTKGNTEGYIQLRFEKNQNGEDNEGGTAAKDNNGGFENVNRVYINFKSVAPGLNIQVGKKDIAFGDSDDYGIGATDAADTFATFNDTGYGLGVFADYKLDDYGTAYVALVNGNGKTWDDNNTQKGLVTYIMAKPVPGVGVNFGYAVNTLGSIAGKNVLDSYYTVQATTSPELTFVSLGLEYDMRKVECDGKIGDGSGSGIAARVGYKMDDLNVVGVYNFLQKSLEEKGTDGFFGGTLDDATKTPTASTIVLAGEYKVGEAIVGLQYKTYMNDAKYALNSDGEQKNKNWADVVAYTQLSF